MEQQGDVPFRAVDAIRLSTEEYAQRRDTTTQNELLRLTQDPAFAQLMNRRRRSEIQHQMFEMVSYLSIVFLIICAVVSAFIYAPRISKYSKSEIQNLIGLQQDQSVSQIQNFQDVRQFQQAPSDVYFLQMNELYDQIAQLKSQKNVVFQSDSKIQIQKQEKSGLFTKFVESNPEYLNFDGDFCPVPNFSKFFRPDLTCPALKSNQINFLEFFNVEFLQLIISQNLGVTTVVSVLIVVVFSFFWNKKNNSVQKNSKNLVQKNHQETNGILQENYSIQNSQINQNNASFSLQVSLSELEDKDEQQFQQVFDLFNNLSGEMQEILKSGEGSEALRSGEGAEVLANFPDEQLSHAELQVDSIRDAMDVIVQKTKSFQLLVEEYKQQYSEVEFQAESSRIGLQQQEESYQEYRKVSIEQLDSVKAKMRCIEKHNADLQSQIENFENERSNFQGSESNLQNYISQLKDTIQQLQFDNKNSREQINLKQLKIDELEAASNIYKEEISKITEKLQIFQKQQTNNKLQSDQQLLIQQQKTEIDRLLAELESYKYKVQALNSQMDAVSQSLSSVEKMEGVEQLVQQSDIDDQVKSLQDKLWQQNHEYTKLQKTHEDTVRQIQWLQQSHDDLHNAHIRLQAEESKFKAAEDEKLRIEERLETIQIEYSQVQDKIIQLMHCNEKLEKQVEKYNNQGNCQKRSVDYLLQQLFLREIQIVTSGNASLISDQQQLQQHINQLYSEKINLEEEVQRLSGIVSTRDDESPRQNEGANFINQQVSSYMHRLSEISNMLRGSTSSPESAEDQQVAEQEKIEQLYEDYMQDIYSNNSYIPVVELEGHLDNLKSKISFLNFNDKENTHSNNQLTIGSNICDDLEEILKQYQEVEEKLAVKVYDKALVMFKSSGLHEVIEHNIQDLENLKQQEEQTLEMVQRQQDLGENIKDMVASEEEMVQNLDQIKKEIDDLLQEQEGLYKQYCELTQSVSIIEEGGQLYPSDMSILAGQPLSPIQSHSSAERIWNQENMTEDVGDSSPRSSLQGTPFKQVYDKQYGSPQSSPSITGGIRRLTFSPKQVTRYSTGSSPQTQQQRDVEQRSRSLNIVSHCPSDHSSYSADDSVNDSPESPSPDLKNLNRQLFQDEDPSPVKAESTQFITPPRNFTFERMVVPEPLKKGSIGNIFADDVSINAEITGSSDQVDKGGPSRTLFTTPPPPGVPLTPFSTPNNAQQNIDMHNMLSPNNEFRTPLSPRDPQ